MQPRRKLLTALLLILGVALMCTLAVELGMKGLRPEPPASLEGEKVNLAMRRTADQLLRLAGDDSTRIDPVEQVSPLSWQLQLRGSLAYDQLPPLLKESLDLHGIRQPYDVAVTDCDQGQVILGYNFLDLTQSEVLPCAGRMTPALSCQRLRVTFSPVAAGRKSRFPLSGVTFSMGLALTFFTLGRARKSSLVPMAEAPAPASAPTGEAPPASPPTSPVLRIGTAVLDAPKLTLTCGGNTIALTYREAKLLQVFGQHPDQVLERNLLLEKVWGEEGIQVSRSLDVFVSRLRKHLKDAPEVQIVAVHGVGYRLTVQQA